MSASVVSSDGFGNTLTLTSVHERMLFLTRVRITKRRKVPPSLVMYTWLHVHPHKSNGGIGAWQSTYTYTCILLRFTTYCLIFTHTTLVVHLFVIFDTEEMPSGQVSVLGVYTHKMSLKRYLGCTEKKYNRRCLRCVHCRCIMSDAISSVSVRGGI